MVGVVRCLGLAKIVICILTIAWPNRTTVCTERLKRRGEKVYTNGWAIKVQGGIETAKRIARSHGFDKVERVSLKETRYQARLHVLRALLVLAGHVLIWISSLFSLPCLAVKHWPPGRSTWSTNYL